MPKTFVVQIVASTFVEDTTCGANAMDASIMLDYTYTYKTPLEATVKGRIISFNMQEDTDTSLSLSMVSASFVVSSILQAGTNVTLSNVLGSTTLSTQLSIQNVQCSEIASSLHLVCNPTSYQIVSSVGIWNSQEGTLRVQLLESVPANHRVSFRFVVRT